MEKGENRLLNSEYLESSREAYVRKVTWIGFFVNILLSGLKFASGFFGRSQALIADANQALLELKERKIRGAKVLKIED